MTKEELINEINQADMILVGLGEEFDAISNIKGESQYQDFRDACDHEKMRWILPAYDNFMRNRYGENEKVVSALTKLAELLEEKNYFIVSTSTNENIAQFSFKDKRLVMPCGSTSYKQCKKKCEHSISLVSQEEMTQLYQLFEKQNFDELKRCNILEKCPNCKEEMVFNTVFYDDYDENGYVDLWQLYMKWLQGTINKKLLILELGVGMKYPSVIRWPFEKVAFYNNKARFVRVNEKLYQLTEELVEKGESIPRNSIDWLNVL